MGAVQWMFRIIFIKYVVLLYCSTTFASCQDASEKRDEFHANGNVGSALKVGIMLPFYNIEIDKLVNSKIAKNDLGVFVLSGNNVFHVNITREKKELNSMGEFSDVGEDVTGFEAIPWRKHVIFIISLIDHFNVYLMELPPPANVIVYPVQKVAIYGKFRKFSYFTTKDEMYLVMATNFTELHGRLSLYKWDRSYFHLKEEKNVQPISDTIAFSNNLKPLLFTIKYGKHRTKTSIQTYILDSDSLKRTQNFYLESNVVFPLHFRQNYYIIACSSRTKICTTYNVTETELTEFNKESFNETFTRFSYGEDYIVGERPGGEFIVATDIRMRCFGVFKSNESDLFEIFTHTDTQDHHFILLTYVQTPKVIIQVVEVTVEAMKDQPNLSSAHSIFEESLTRLRGFLLSSLHQINAIKNDISFDRIENENRLITKSPIYIDSGRVGKVNVIGEDFLDLQQLSNKIVKLRDNLRKLENNKKERAKRSADMFKAKKVKAKNLVYNGTVFEGIKLQDGHLVINASSVTTDSLAGNKVEINSSRSFPTSRTVEPFTEDPNASQLNTKNLVVENINGIDWKTFYETLFLKNQGTPVQGTVTFQEPVQIVDLKTNQLNTREVRNFFTLTTEQDVHSSLLLSKLRAPSLQAGLVNGLKFDSDVVAMGTTETVVKTPVIARWMKIEKNLTLSDEDHRNFARHFLGNEANNFLQIYTNKVIINGSITLQNVDLEKEKPKIFVAENEIDFDFKERFWLKSVDQEFDTVTFMEPVTLQTVNVNYLNGNEISNFLLNNREPTGHVSLIINSSTILGNVKSDTDIPTSKVAQINANVIRKFERTNVFGVKEFSSGLSVDIIETSTLNDIPVDDLVTVDSNDIEFKGRKNCSSITVEDQFDVQNLHAQRVNDANLDDFFKAALTVDQDLVFDELTLSDNANFGNISFTTFNDFQMSQFMKFFEISGDKILLRKDVSIKGNTVFEKNLNTTWINSIKWNDYYNLLVFLDTDSQIGGVKIFVDSITVTDANIHSINGVDFDELARNLLSKSKHQTIKAPWSFEYVEFKSVSAPMVNGIRTDLLIDSRDPQVVIDSGLVVNEMEVAGNVFGSIDIDFIQLRNKLKSFDQQHWKDIKILKGAKWDINGTDLHFLIENAVRVDSDQIINGNVTFKENVHFNTVDGNFLINGIDIFAVYNDSLLRKKDSNQVVVAPKNFIKTLKASQLIAQNYLAAQVVNNVDVIGFNESIFRRTEDLLVSDRKTFVQSPFIEYLKVYGTVNLMDLSNVVTNMHQGILPPIRFSDITIRGGLTVGKVNEVDLDYFLSSRARKSGPPQELYGYITFESLTLHNTTLTSINDIDIDDVVLKDSQSLQEIYGTKRISGNLYLMGPVYIVNLNDVDLTLRYEESILLDSDVNLQSIFVRRAHFEDDLLVNGILNGHPISDYFKWFKRFCEEISYDIKKISDLHNTIQSNVDRLFLAKRLLYLEYDSNKNVFWNRTSNNAMTEQVITTSCSDRDTGNSCQAKKMLIQVLPDRIYLNKFEDTEVLKSRLQNLKVIVQNKVVDKITEMNILWESERSHGYYQKNITFDYMIEKVETFEVPGNPSKFLLVQFAPSSVDTPIVLIKLDSVKNQPFPIQALNHYSKEADISMNLYHFHDKVFLITASDSTIFIWEFSAKEEMFRNIQNITELYNIYDLVEVENHLYHLLLSCKTCDHIVVYKIDMKYPSIHSNFHRFQTVQIRKHVSKITHFVNPSGVFLVIATQSNEGSYFLYKYSFFEGWTYTTYGYFSSIRHAIPFRDVPSYEDYILLISGNSSTAVLAYSQG